MANFVCCYTYFLDSKPIAPFERSGPKIFVVDSEAHTYEISSYAVKSKRFYVLGWKYAQNTKKGPKSRH